MSQGKVSPGQDFNPPPARIWNNMVDAGRAWADGRFNNPANAPTRPRETDVIKIKNTSGALRRKGEILKIDGKAIETVADEYIWLAGAEPTDACRFGILKGPADTNGIERLQVSGVVGVALVNITDEAHTFAEAATGEYVLQSGTTGSIEILYAPAGTGEKECVVRFAGGSGSSGTTGACPCVCLDHGDILVGGIETTSVFEIAMSDEDFKQTDGTITFPAGTYRVVRGSGDTEWSLDIGDLLTATYTSGVSATSATTMDGTLTMGFDAYGVPFVKLCVTGTVPAEP